MLKIEVCKNVGKDTIHTIIHIFILHSAIFTTIVKEIETFAFSGCAYFITSLLDSITTIGACAFNDYYSIIEYNTHFVDYWGLAFNGCKNVVNVYIHSSAQYKNFYYWENLNSRYSVLVNII